MTNKESTKRNSPPSSIDAVKTGIIRPESQPVPTDSLFPQDSLSLYLVVLELLRRPVRHLTSAPTFTPRNFAESIQFYDDATNRRIYLYVNGVWRYAALT